MTCRYCGRTIIEREGLWIDPEATGDDSIWREVCDSHDTFVADHEPATGAVLASLALAPRNAQGEVEGEGW